MNKWPYNTSRWRKLRRLKLSVSPLCEHCKFRGRAVFAKLVDHIKPISQGGEPFPSLDRLQSLCQTCHNHKTGSEKAGRTHRVQGYDIEGNPIDPSHDWHGGPNNHEKALFGKPTPKKNAYLVLDSESGETEKWV